MSPLKLPRTLRLDPSDTFVFAQAAEPGEWAVTGSFLFLDAEPDALSPKERAAFRSGFLGVASFGFSTLVVVSEATESERAEAVAALARHILDELGAPDPEAARAAAEEEIAVAASLCGPPVGTVIALARSLEAGALKERFRTLQRREAMPGADRLHAQARAFTFVETDDEPDESVDLVGLMGTGPR
ncbi:DUF6505 family protein [Methylobacterium oxalidis]|uniref:Uncharacterized protein n=1 Tax=Methylobacterium oxalidis TaxID=944322 RepID=A0A512J736_9HYPH|nr:DUF6505 family protein [Methylobacterium oxalidis]GEP05781.1 hypothetical protein MOX02_38190 [Methylobacterium oxalidis]GJE33296.1 hypothetical protein LDDCCGHA_3496 [Methylobacterium oxalidis]GLS62636.1 hypothetical protein GCM10007888_10170 [Methylobacterium oxalidis]